METVNKHGLMKLYILVNTETEKNMEKENLCGLMIVHMKGNFLKTTFMVLENMNGKMEEFMKVNGKTTKWKVKAPLLGQMVVNMSEIMSKIVKKVSEFLPLKMEEYMKANGSTENNMEEESLRRKIFRDKEFGKMVNELGG